jgi:adenylate cyclase
MGSRFLRAQVTIWGTAALLVLLIALTTTQSYDMARERAFDWMLSHIAQRPARVEPLVVDIDRASLASHGAWPWPRELLARLVGAIADSGARALAIDMLIDTPDTHSPAALARQLAASTDDQGVRRLASELADGDTELARQLVRLPAVLGVALDPQISRPPIPAPPLLARGWPNLDGLWRAAGPIAPIAPLAEASAGLGVLALPADVDGALRRVPLLAATRQQVVPGLAVELVRIAKAAGNLLVTEGPATLTIGDSPIPLSSDGLLRLYPARTDERRERTISAADLLASRAPDFGGRLKGQIVLLGSSAPEIGGLRLTAGDELVPSVQLQADAVAQLLAGMAPMRPRLARVAEVVAMIMCGVVGGWLARRLAPLPGALATGLVSIAWLSIALVALYFSQHLVDPTAPPASAIACFACAALAKAAETARRAAAIQRRFEQHLAPDVVRRLVEHPQLLRLQGEARVVTVLFTDVEGFTAMTERSDPAVLVAVLDRYFEGLTRIVTEQGGMVDKLVGDGLHAIFNAPVDLDNHAARALECAIAIRRFTTAFRSDPEAANLGFGRTRVGMETGDAIVGDVGGGHKLDYTAYGNVINTAARLEAANKELKSDICVGPGAAARLPADVLRPLGQIELRGRSAPQQVYEPWPTAYTEADRRAWLDAMCLIDTDVNRATAVLEMLQLRMGSDPALANLVARLHAQAADTSAT